MQSWNQWQVPSGNSAALPQPPVGLPAAGQDPMATMQAYMQYYNQPAPTGYTAEQWAAAQQQNWTQWSQWQHQYQQWQNQYGDKYQESMKQFSNLHQQPPMPSMQPPLPKDENLKPPLPPDASSSYGFSKMPPPHQNNLPLFPSKTNSGQDVNPPLPTNPPLPPDLNSSVSDSKSSAELESAKKLKLDEEKMIEIEKTFDAQFKQWEEQFNTWKQKNANHPDKEQYKQYEAKWTSWREKLLERREQMRRKREQQKQAAKNEVEKKDGDKIMNILSSTENQGLINNLLGIGKTLGLTGKAEAPQPVATPAVSNQSSVSALQNAPMTPEMSQHSWAAQQWAQQYNASYGYHVPPPPPKPTPNVSQSPNVSMPPPNFCQASTYSQIPNFAPQSSNYMQPPPNFAQPPPSFNSDQKKYSKQSPFTGQSSSTGNQSEMCGSEMLKRKEEMDSHEDTFDNMNDRRMDGNRFGQSNRNFVANDSFNPNRFDSNYSQNQNQNQNQNQFNSSFNKGNDWFGNDNKNDSNRFNSNRFSGSNDRFSSGGGFGKPQNEAPHFDNELAPELRKLMEKRRAAMDAFKPRSSFLDPEKTLNVGSLRESFKKITGDTLFKPRSFGGTDDSGSFGSPSSFGPRGSSFGPRGFNEFEPRGSSFGPRGAASFGPRGSSNFSPRINSFAPFAPSHPLEQKSEETNVAAKSEDNQNQRNVPKDQPMEPPKMPEILKEEIKTIIEEEEVIVLPKESDQNSDIEIIHSSTDNKPPDHSWIKPQQKREPEPQQEPVKNENLPFMGDDDPKPTDLNMEPPPEFPNLGPVIQTPMDPPPAFIDHPFSQEEFPKDFTRFESFAPRSQPPFGMRGPGSFGPRGGGNQQFNQTDQFSPRGMNQSFKPTFGPRGMDSFNPRGMSNQFGPRGGQNQSFGPRMDKPSFGPRGENPAFGSSFNRPPFGPRDSFQDQPKEPPNRIPSLFDLKFDPKFKKSEEPEQQQQEMDFSDDNFESGMDKPAQPFKQDMPRSFNQDLPQRNWNQNQNQSYDEDFTSENAEVEMNQEQENEPMDTRQNISDTFSQPENGSNYDPFEIFKNRRKQDAEMRKPPVEFCAKTQFNYNHGVGPMSQATPTISQPDLRSDLRSDLRPDRSQDRSMLNRSIMRSIHDHIPVKVIDYQHSKRKVQELLTTIESYDYGHGSLKPTIPDQIQSLRKDFRNWEESEQNLREYSERLKSWEYESHQNQRLLAREFRLMRQEKAWREEMAYRENKFKRRQAQAQWDADIEFKRMRYEKEYGYHHEKKDKERKYKDKNIADDDVLEEISWDGDNDRSLKDFNEDTNKEENSKSDSKNGADSNKRLDITKTTTCTTVDSLLCMPGRQNRPPKIVIILRGPPGSGKSYIAKLIKDKEVEQGGCAPRILSIDDYFLVEKEVETTDDNGKKITSKEMVYEYEEVMESSYTASLGKAFKKNITDGFFNFIILDSINEKITDYEELWSFAKSKGFKVYVCEMEMDPQICLKRNIHKRSEDEINRIIDYFEPTPSHHYTLDVNSMLQEEIKDVQIAENDEAEMNDSLKDQDSQEESRNPAPISKWETMDAEDKLDRLDGLTKHKHDGKPQTMEDFLQVPDYYDMEDTTGKKRVRWADLEERKEQEKMRAVGFVVGHTNWDRMMDPTKGSSALTRTKYI